MGYYTRYTLEIEDFGKVVDSCEHKKKDEKYCPECGRRIEIIELREYIIEQLKNEESEGDFNPSEIIDNESDGWKWYDHEEYMKNISGRFPSVLFILSGTGEESGDIWKKYFLGGKVQVEQARIVIDPFDKEKLK